MNSEPKYIYYRHMLVWDGDSHAEPELSPCVARRLLADSDAWLLRNIYDWDTPDPTDFWEVIKDYDTPLEHYDPKTRTKIRRSLRECDIRLIDNHTLVADNGYEVYSRAFERYRHNDVPKFNRNEWESRISRWDHFEYWGVYDKSDGKLIAWAANLIYNDTVNYSMMNAVPDKLNSHKPNHGLIYTMNRYYLGQQGYRYVTDGFRSITQHSSIQDFLEHDFKFRKAYCRVRLHYRWWMRIAVTLIYPWRRHIRHRGLHTLLNLETLQRGC